MLVECLSFLEYVYINLVSIVLFRYQGKICLVLLLRQYCLEPAQLLGNFIYYYILHTFPRFSLHCVVQFRIILPVHCE